MRRSKGSLVFAVESVLENQNLTKGPYKCCMGDRGNVNHKKIMSTPITSHIVHVAYYVIC